MLGIGPAAPRRPAEVRRVLGRSVGVAPLAQGGRLEKVLANDVAVLLFWNLLVKSMGKGFDFPDAKHEWAPATPCARPNVS